MRPPDNDTLLFFDFRSDRMREISEAFGYEAKKFEPAAVRQGLHITTFTLYKASFPFPVMFAQQSMDNVLAEWLGKQKVPQFHIAGKRRASEGVFDTFACAETEKYAHVTFFFNGGIEKQFDLEERAMVPSPKVATYNLQPQMSALEVGEEVAKVVAQETHPFVMCNFAPPDMVGHTGVYEAAIKAVEATDTAIGTIYEACKKHNYVLFVTADHGNAEQMLSADGKGPHTAHTCNRVPFVMTSAKHSFVRNAEPEAKLADVAPTILAVLGIFYLFKKNFFWKFLSFAFAGLPIPAEMDGKSLLA